ncbi:cysteine and tyrosine-rich protein 1-like [Saccostrea cucullata]|uniref:cysteine and tyrosine-rich protein 1-like n=1 Tax=Saccostrea cuccullata TaxID=36930 RepID=UPI002ED49C9E
MAAREQKKKNLIFYGRFCTSRTAENFQTPKTYAAYYYRSYRYYYYRYYYYYSSYYSSGAVIGGAVAGVIIFCIIVTVVIIVVCKHVNRGRTLIHGTTGGTTVTTVSNSNTMYTHPQVTAGYPPPPPSYSSPGYSNPAYSNPGYPPPTYSNPAFPPQPQPAPGPSGNVYGSMFSDPASNGLPPKA